MMKTTRGSCEAADPTLIFTAAPQVYRARQDMHRWVALQQQPETLLIERQSLGRGTAEDTVITCPVNPSP